MTIHNNTTSPSGSAQLPAPHEVTPLTYKKRLEGISATREILGLVEGAVALAKTDLSTVSNPDLVLQAQKTLLDHDKVRLEQQHQQQDKENTVPNNKKNKKAQEATAIPIFVLKAASVVLESEKNNDNNISKDALDKAIRASSLAFTPPPSHNDDAEGKDRQQFQARLERLRLKQEETRYNRLTKNVVDAKALQQTDEITTKSMTYAASIGLNMIVAPLSFGCFMYFFSGNLLGWIAGDHEDDTDQRKHHSSVNIRRVIVSVVSGVVMLFIEMILFVIRTHEVDKAMRSKQKKHSHKSRAFGYYTANTERHYKDQ